MKGWVYVISNKALQGLVKVGYTTKDPELRAAELNHTGSPHPYVVEYEMLIEEPRQIEQQTHERLSSKNEAKEWFRCSAEEAVTAIKQVAGTRAISETYKRAERAKVETLRKQAEVEKAVEDQLRNAEAAIRGKFEQQIAASCPPRLFWKYWFGCGILVVFALALLVTKISDGALIMLSVIGGGIAGKFLEEYFEKKRKKSISYLSFESQRDQELAAMRMGPELKEFLGDAVEIVKCTQRVEKIIGGLLSAEDIRKIAIEVNVKIRGNVSKQNVINQVMNSYPGIITDEAATNIYIALTKP